MDKDIYECEKCNNLTHKNNLLSTEMNDDKRFLWCASCGYLIRVYDYVFDINDLNKAMRREIVNSKLNVKTT